MLAKTLWVVLARGSVCFAGQGRAHQGCILRCGCGRNSSLARQGRRNLCEARIGGGSCHGAERAFASFGSGL